MGPDEGFEVVRDPLWNNIGIGPDALRVLDSEPFQRLRYVRQLGHAFLVYPGATHTRFEHALGTYHLARRALGMLADRGELDHVAREEITVVRLAALLHDIGHYPFSHGLEEAGLPSHETLAPEQFRHPELNAALGRIGIVDLPDRISRLIAGTSPSPLRGLISGALDLDKIEYLTRDARMCGVPYGTVDVDRLLHSLTLVGADGQTVGLHEKGASALESLLFAKYQMYRNVYWHHAVRSATAMFKRAVRAAIAAGRLDAARIARTTDDALMEVLGEEPLVLLLRRRRLHKRVVDVAATELPPGAGRWIAERPDLVERLEDRLAEELGLPPDTLLVDFPAKPAMLSSDIAVVTRKGAVAPAQLGLQRVADDLHAAARRLRVYVARPCSLPGSAVIALAERTATEIAATLEAGEILLGR